MSAFVELDNLVSLISSAVEQLKEEYNQLGYSLPTLDDVKEPAYNSAQVSDRLEHAVQCIQGACSQLSTLITPPKITLALRAKESYNCACLGIAVEAKVADQLVGHPEGLHVSKLAAATGLCPRKLCCVLRILATKHCFREVSPDVFANNRLSMLLISSTPTAAHVAVCADEGLKATATLSETFFDPVLSQSYASNQSSWNVAMNYKGTLWDFYQNVDPVRRKRFGKAMIGYSSMVALDQILHGYPWEKLSHGTTVCDLGGGMGHVSMHILKATPQLQVVLQDLPATIEEAKGFWLKSAPELVEKHRVRFASVDFLKQSPVPDCDIYFLKSIVHDWPDKDSKTILTNITRAMKPGARVILQEFVLQPPVCDNEEDKKFLKTAPDPLLPNYGEGSILHLYSNLSMLSLFNSQERTLRELAELGNAAGLELVGLYHCGLTSALEFKLKRN
ncbi:S-adenosyl-L-methionine-dependent methyltransferase [Panus rudis PR-1116 ss-1]|nr:S-adenosyl-L-methionine-dependent methyltransferase [Panus rudis PR-1116 ss-1]